MAKRTKGLEQNAHSHLLSVARSKVAAKALIPSTHWVDLPEECDEVPVHGDAVDHPVGERDPAYLDVVAAANGVLDGDVLKPLVAKPE